MLQPELESSLHHLAEIVPSIEWWEFHLPGTCPGDHIWIRLPGEIEVACGKPSNLPEYSDFLGRLNILHWGAECRILGQRIAPSTFDQVICIERVASRPPKLIWVDVNQEAVVSFQKAVGVVDVSRPTKAPVGSKVWGWLSGELVVRAMPLLVDTERYFFPVDFSCQDDIAVLLSTSDFRSPKCDRRTPTSDEHSLPPPKLIVINPQMNVTYPCDLDPLSTAQLGSSLGHTKTVSQAGGDGLPTHCGVVKEECKRFNSNALTDDQFEPPINEESDLSAQSG
uniref:Tudor domain-containing protein n=1 Tax=Mesocestoides corti TaxID=53468 RepID=A0A5K3F0Z1_MESCO